MTLKEAIKRTEERQQLAAWLRELKERREYGLMQDCYGCKHDPSKEKAYCRTCKRIYLDKYEKDDKQIIENCCKNCQHNGDYDGWNEFICKYYNCMIRGEHYDCEGFEPERKINGT